MMEFKVDLRWSLWTVEEGTWETCSPGLLGKMVQALEVEGAFTVHTAPKKEIRFGSVTVRKVTEGFSAAVDFSAEWDDVPSLLDTLGLPDEERDSLEETVPRNDNGDPGFSVSESITAETFEALWARIDNVENRLIEQTETGWKQLKEMYAKQ